MPGEGGTGGDMDLDYAAAPRRVMFTDAGWSSSVARWAHNPEVAGSNPVPATESEGPVPMAPGLRRSLHPARLTVCAAARTAGCPAPAASGAPAGCAGR